MSNLKPYHHGDEWVRQGVHTVAKRNKSKIYFSHFFVFFSIVFVVMTMARDRCCQTILQKSTMVLGRGPCRRGEGEEGEREEGRGRRRRWRGGKEGNEEKVGRRRGGEMGEREREIDIFNVLCFYSDQHSCITPNGLARQADLIRSKPFFWRHIYHDCLCVSHYQYMGHHGNRYTLYWEQQSSAPLDPFLWVVVVH